MIRPYKDTDCEAVLELWLLASADAHRFAGEGFWLARAGDMRDKYLPLSETWVWVDERADGRVAGFLCLSDHTVEALFVHPDRQGEGIGRQLLDRAKSLRGNLSLCVYELNVRARRFYEREGFVCTETRTDPLSGLAERVMEYRPRK